LSLSRSIVIGEPAAMARARWAASITSSKRFGNLVDAILDGDAGHRQPPDIRESEACSPPGRESKGSRSNPRHSSSAAGGRAVEHLAHAAPEQGMDPGRRHLGQRRRTKPRSCRRGCGSTSPAGGARPVRRGRGPIQARAPAGRAGPSRRRRAGRGRRRAAPSAGALAPQRALDLVQRAEQSAGASRRLHAAAPLTKSGPAPVEGPGCATSAAGATAIPRASRPQRGRERPARRARRRRAGSRRARSGGVRRHR
jgi:hypothetical protein